MATLEVTGELAGPVNDESAPLASAAPAQAPIDADDASAPPEITAVFQGGILVLMLLGAAYAAAEVILPIVLAFVLMLVLRPAMRLLEKWHLPRGLAALALIVTVFGS